MRPWTSPSAYKRGQVSNLVFYTHVGGGGGGGERKTYHTVTAKLKSLKWPHPSKHLINPMKQKSVLAPEEAGSRCMDKLRADHSGSHKIKREWRYTVLALGELGSRHADKLHAGHSGLHSCTGTIQAAIQWHTLCCYHGWMRRWSQWEWGQQKENAG